MIKGYKIRIYPTKDQENMIWQHIGACRFIWNYMLNLQQQRLVCGEKFMSAFDMNELLGPLKKAEGYTWLNQVSNASLQRVCKSLSDSYIAFCKRTKNHPKYKRKKSGNQSFPVRCDIGTLYFLENTVRIPKIGFIKIKTDYVLPYGRTYKFSNARISYINGKYILSFGMECENQAPKLTDKIVGIDLGIKELAVVACNGEKMVFHNINKSSNVRDLERKLKHAQRSVSRKREHMKLSGSNKKSQRLIKSENKVRALYAKLSNIRHNYIHQTTHEIVSLLPSRVTMEDINVAGLMKNKHISKAVAEQCFNMFIYQMKYKCEMLGIQFVQAHRFYPSSKLCSCCGNIKRNLKLTDRTYVCECCGLQIDRDYNAAINLMRYTDLHSKVVA